jgi:DNA modification methylase
MEIKDLKLQVVYLPVNDLKKNNYNPRKWDKEAADHLKESISRFGLVDPFIVNSAPERCNVIIGGEFRLAVAKELGIQTAPCVYVDIPDLEKEKELNLRLNRNHGEFNLELLAEFDESFLANAGFSSEELDKILEVETAEEVFDLEEELKKLDIGEISVNKGDIYDLDGSRLMCGDSTIEADMLKLMDGRKADMCMTDEPYILDYLHGKTRRGEATTGFGAKKNRRYLETESLPDNFIELWMNNVAKVQADNFSIISFENWKNIRGMWNEMEKHWKVKNMIVWHLSNRIQGFSAKYKFFNKYDIAMVGCTADANIEYNQGDEGDGLQNQYEAALFAISGKPQWEPYEKGKKYCPTDFIEHTSDDERSSGQGIVFGTKPVEILIPYIKVLTKRGQLVLEPFGGSGSTLIACTKLGRKCCIMEKCPIYAEVIINRWEKLTGKKRVKII